MRSAPPPIDSIIPTIDHEEYTLRLGVERTVPNGRTFELRGRLTAALRKTRSMTFYDGRRTPAGNARICLAALLLVAGGCNPGVAGIVLMPTLFNPCSYDGTLTFHLSEMGAPNWGGTTVWLDREKSRGYQGVNVPGGTVQVAFADDEPETDMKLAGTPLEVYRGDDRLGVRSTHESRGHVDGSCGYAQVEAFDLSALEPGSYTLVHRRSSGVNGEVHCGREACKWGLFEGEAALVTKLVIPGAQDRPALTVEDVEALVRPRFDRIRACYQPLVEKMSSAPADEDIMVELRVLPDRAYGMAMLSDKIDATAPVARCIRAALDYLRFDSRPVEPMVARYRIVVSTVPGGFATVEVDATFVELVAEA